MLNKYILILNEIRSFFSPVVEHRTTTVVTVRITLKRFRALHQLLTF